ncbi:hypothetical protein [Kribbella sp. NPDC051620]|uniref:hypothetical protein n=1 Tax=Kribbella sp. NPDC051620 TaxID=3364120 RepID=UPI0037AE1E86
MAALASEKMYGYVPNTGKFHDNNALRNDFYMERYFSYEPIGSAEARRLIDNVITPMDEADYADALTRWRADPNPLTPTEVLSMAAGFNP